jgi:C4-dicarboxylate transporter DctM subunit
MENAVVVACLVVMVLVPLLEAGLRQLLQTGVASSAAIVQHCCLVLGMAGGAIAARDDRLLALSVLGTVLTGKKRAMARWVGNTLALVITIALGYAAAQFVWQERAAGNVLVYGIPRWVVELSMPVGFGLIAARLAWRMAATLRWRMAGLGLAVGLLACGWWPPLPLGWLVGPALGLLVVAAVLGTPVFVVLGGAAVILFWAAGEPLAVLPINHYGLVVNATLPTIPLFTLAGYFLAEGGASKRLIGVCMALVGHWRGGPAVAATLACAFFTTFTGASGVTILALGGLLLPMLVMAGYTERRALGLLTGAGSLGLLFPPCLPPILYAIVANIRIEELFLGGLLPGFLLVGLTALLGVWQAPRQATARRRFSWREAGRAIGIAKWELLIPVVAVAGLFGGFCTPLEAAALTAAYAFVVEVFVYRDLHLWRDVPRVMTECALLVGGVVLILGVALGLTDYLVSSEAPDRLLVWVQATIHERWVFLLVLNLILLAVGCLMDVFSAIVVVAPLLVPLGVAFGIDPVHLGVIFLANLELGFLTPPVGMNLFLASYRFGKPLGEVTRAALPMLAVLALGVALITYLPVLTTWFR